LGIRFDGRPALRGLLQAPVRRRGRHLRSGQPDIRLLPPPSPPDPQRAVASRRAGAAASARRKGSRGHVSRRFLGCETRSPRRHLSRREVELLGAGGPVSFRAAIAVRQSRGAGCSWRIHVRSRLAIESVGASPRRRFVVIEFVAHQHPTARTGVLETFHGMRTDSRLDGICD
jgi:hypothetical protein